MASVCYGALDIIYNTARKVEYRNCNAIWSISTCTDFFTSFKVDFSGIYTPFSGPHIVITCFGDHVFVRFCQSCNTHHPAHLTTIANDEDSTLCFGDSCSRSAWIEFLGLGEILTGVPIRSNISRPFLIIRQPLTGRTTNKSLEDGLRKIMSNADVIRVTRAPVIGKAEFEVRSVEPQI